MSRLNSKEERNKVGKSIRPSYACCSEQFPWISLRHMTKNKRYSLEFFSHPSERADTLEKLYQKFEELSATPWNEWMAQPKTRGMETINYEQLNFSPAPSLNIMKDEKFMSFDSIHIKGREKGGSLDIKGLHAQCCILLGMTLTSRPINTNA